MGLRQDDAWHSRTCWTCRAVRRCFHLPEVCVGWDSLTPCMQCGHAEPLFQPPSGLPHRPACASRTLPDVLAAAVAPENLRRRQALPPLLWGNVQREHQEDPGPGVSVSVSVSVSVCVCVCVWVWVCVCVERGSSSWKGVAAVAGECGACILPHSTKLWMQVGGKT